MKIFASLTKFKLSAMNSSVTAFGYLVTAPMINPFVLFAMLGGNMLMAMSSQVMGQIIEVDEDKKMRRTTNRPLPSNLLSLSKAKGINISFWTLANCALYFGGVAPMSILISNATYASYYLYIKMKPITKLNTLFGAIVGSLPLLIGISHNISPLDIGIKEICDLSYLFFWQFLHFYGIVVIYREDYGKSNFKMESDNNRLSILFMGAALAMAVISYIKLNQGADTGFLKVCQVAFLTLHSIFLKYIIAFWKHPTSKSGETIKRFAYILFFAYFFLSNLVIRQSNLARQRQPENNGNKDKIKGLGGEDSKKVSVK